MLRQTSGSSLCYACGKLNRVDAPVCFYCGARRPGLWGFAPVLGRLVGRFEFSRLVIAVSIAAYAVSILLDPAAALQPRGPFNFLSPSTSALVALGMTGAFAAETGRWWTLFTAIYLHGSLLHIAFNLLWVRDLGRAVESVYGWSRTALIFTAAGVVGFLASNWAGVTMTVGASGAVFGLLAAMVAYGRDRGGLFGMAVFRQYWQWSLILFVMGFLMPGVNNLAHAGGFFGGYLSSLALGSRERWPERAWHRVAAGLAVLVTAASFGLAAAAAVAAR
jgi:rhomboid protease GluP